MLQLDGNTLAGGFQSRLNALSLRLEGMGHPAIGVASGRRSKALQEQIFRDRYRRQDSGNGPYGDVRWWDGDGNGRRERWVRVKSGGTVLPPGDSTHEDPPATGADLSYPYNNRYTAAHAALVSVCAEYGIRWTGVDFGEDWHFDSIWNPYVAFAAGEAKPLNPPATIPAAIRPLEVSMAGFNPVQPLYRHTGLNQYLVLDLLTKRARLIPSGDWEQNLINEENERIADRVKNVEKRELHVTDSIHRDITPEQWATAYADFTYTFND